ncbi:Exonuclease SbcC [Lachnospiraceae bacterium TWA4]|nr:Exonuclease SbcC [Lachnospiraceae bacterium TWA4]
MQVGMIPQGEFMQILRASTNDKLDIFRKLFNTEIYRGIIEELKNRRTEMKKQVEILDTQCRTEYGHVLDAQDLEFLEFSFETSISYLENLCRQQREDYKQCLSEWKKYVESYETLQKEHAESTYIHLAYKEQNEAREWINKFTEKLPQIEEKKILLDKASKAWQILPICNAVKESENRLEETKCGIEEIKNILPLIEKEVLMHEKQKNELEPIQKSAHEEFIALKGKVDTAVESYKKIKDYKNQLTDISSEDLLQLKNKTEQSILAMKQSILKIEKEQEQLKTIEVEITRLEKEQEIAQETRALKKQLDAQEKLVHRAIKTYEKRKEEYQVNLSIYEHLNQVFLDNQAGLLGSNLKENEPCPVCGSTNHPRVAKLKGDLGDLKVTANEVKKAKDKKEASQVEQEKQAREVSKEKGLYEGLKRQVEERPTLDFEEINKQLKEAKSQKEYRDKLDKQLKKLKQEVEELSDKEDKLEKKIQECEKEKSKLEASIQELMTSCLFESEEAAKEILQQVKIKDTQLTSELERILEKLEEKRKLQIQKQGKLSKLKEEKVKEENRLNDKNGEYELSLQKANLTQDEVLQLVDEIPFETIKAEEENILIIYQKLEESKKTIERTSQVILDRTDPDISVLEQKLREVSELKDELEGKKSRLKHIVETNEQVLKNLKKKLDDSKKLRQMYKTVEHLYLAASGQKNQKNKKMDIETFVQRYYLQKILVAANKRFYKMSLGQFQLTLKAIDDAGNARNEGLDLMVHSLVTNSDREVKTLSGGESFMAALALALGMADIIQSMNGKVRLDMMFIDEGFGSLDEVSRNQAVRILKELAGGQRMIGIISHVTELKNQIDDQLVVKKDGNGSYVKWEV